MRLGDGHSRRGARRPGPPILFAALLVALVAPPGAAARRSPTVAFLCPESCSNLPNTNGAHDQAFLAGLRWAGHELGRNVSLDTSGVGVGLAALPAAASRLVRRKVDVIVAVGNDAARAARQATASTPIVMLNVADAVEDGLVASLGRPGANVTGLSVPLEQIATKRIELLREMNPRLARVAVLWDPRFDTRPETRFARIERAARHLGVQVALLAVSSFRDLDREFEGTGAGRPDGLLLFERLIGSIRGEIALFAIQLRVATAGSDRSFAQAGGLLAYGPYLPDQYERAAFYVGSLLKGAQPRALPVEEPTRYELSINKATARILGLAIPLSLELRADHIVD